MIIILRTSSKDTSNHLMPTAFTDVFYVANTSQSSMWIYFSLLHLKNSISDRQIELHQFLYIESRYVFFPQTFVRLNFSMNVGRKTQCTQMHGCRTIFPHLAETLKFPHPHHTYGKCKTTEREMAPSVTSVRACVMYNMLTQTSFLHDAAAAVLDADWCACEEERKRERKLNGLSHSLISFSLSLIFSWLFFFFFIYLMRGGGNNDPTWTPVNRRDKSAGDS